MRTSETVVIQRDSYTAPHYQIPTTNLLFDLHPMHTRVTSQLSVVRSKGVSSDTPLELNGVELKLISVSVDGVPLASSDYDVTDTTLTLFHLPSTFTLSVVTEIAPDTNTALEGLYRSSGNFCTQCEAEGFRKITYYLDRPDVLSVFTVTLEGDFNELPVMLSNGNPVSNQRLSGERHQWVWHDPHPKPCYLFALVAGTLEVIEDSFTTGSGREVLLQIYVEAHNKHLCDYAMGALKRSMAWDEEAYGLEYDLDRFMIVAVDDFNMGAMENKGLNVFNSKFVLASYETATDSDFIGVEAVIAHEYFHNWSGNRVTCRDWFQLSLKEGLTVFRDQCFTADHHSPTVKRIQDVQLLRNHQFAEDASAMSHPIRPDSYVEINNFYTLTVYEKGAEVIRMLHTLLGAEVYRAGVSLYFERHDGQAVTCDDFLDAMQAVTEHDLSQFRRWYSQAGTPEVTAHGTYDADNRQYQLTLSQRTPDTPGQKNKLPLHIPVDVALFDAAGTPQTVVSDESLAPTPGGGALLSLTDREQSWTFTDLDDAPVVSLLRQFSAPVKVHFDYSADTLSLLLARDTDTFNRWEAGQRLATRVIEELEAGTRSSLGVYLDAIEQVIVDEQIDDALKAEIITPPTFDAIALSRDTIEVHSILAARKELRIAVAQRCAAQLNALIAARPVDQHFDDALSDSAMASRALANAALSALSVLSEDHWLSTAEQRYRNSQSMTDRMGALSVLAKIPGAVRDGCLKDFHDSFSEHKLVIDKWFAVQACADYDNALGDIQALIEHPSFDATNPNRLRSVYSAFANANPALFHAVDGSGYRWISDAVMQVDAKNPQVAARLVTPLTRWQKMPAANAGEMQEALRRIERSETVSTDVLELVSKSLTQA